MKIVFHGGNAANFREGIEAWLDDSHEILTLSDALSRPGERESFAAADVIVGVRLGVAEPVPTRARLYHAPAAGTDAIDPARLPEKPTLPNRPKMNLMGMAAGLGLGIALVGLLEYRDSSFRTDTEVTAVLTLPVLAVVPLMQSDEDRNRATRRRLFMGVGLGSTVLGCLAVLVYTFVR